MELEDNINTLDDITSSLVEQAEHAVYLQKMAPMMINDKKG